MNNMWLLAGGISSAIAALLHLACIVGGGGWYRAMGAGERMVRAVERGSIEPHLITLAIASVLAGWSAFALSGAGILPRLPFLRLALVAITAVYLLRALALPILIRAMPDRSMSFLISSSVIVLAIGVVHAIGVARTWKELG